MPPSLPARATMSLAALACCLPLAALADVLPEAEAPDVLVVGQKGVPAAPPPSSSATVTAAQIAQTINAVNVEDTVKYLPSLIVRKRHIGDTQAPLATRTAGLGASARSLIFADGVLLSALVGNNNTTASPRWSMVSPAEIERVDVLYGPFSAAYAGNAIGAVVNITTRLPERREATLGAGTSVQTFDQYGTHRTLPTYQLAATYGDRIGPLALFAAFTHTDSRGQPLAYVTGTRAATPSAAGVATTGGYDDVNRTGQPIRVFGASGFEHQRQDNAKLKLALDLPAGLRLSYVGGLFLNHTRASAETYLNDTASGAPVYASGASPLNIGGYAYAVAASAFSGGVYRYDERHWSHALTLAHEEGAVRWRVIGTLYRYAEDVQRTPSGALPAANAGGAGSITRLDGTGWGTIDASLDAAIGTHTLSVGAHGDRVTLASNRYATADWVSGGEGALTQVSRGRTRTLALWGQDAWRLTPALTLTLGGRYEWWRAYDGYNVSTSPVLAPTVQPVRSAAGFSPKASLAWQPARDWTVRLSAGRALRFPTVGELYQAVTTGTVLTVPDPSLRPERAWSEELAIERVDARGNIRVSLFDEIVRDALIAQSAPLVAGSPALYSYVQNVDRTRARGVEIAATRTDFPLRGVDLSGSVTYADATIRADAAFPAAIGKRIPSVPRWKASGVATWRPASGVSLTAAARYASRGYGTIDNSDSVAATYQGFQSYFVADLRAAFQVARHYTFAVGVDNVNNARYYLFHPFPQRTLHAEVTMRW